MPYCHPINCRQKILLPYSEYLSIHCFIKMLYLFTNQVFYKRAISPINNVILLTYSEYL